MNKLCKFFAFLLGAATLFGGLAVFGSKQQINKFEEVKAEEAINDSFDYIYSDTNNNIANGSSRKFVLLCFSGTAHGLANNTQIASDVIGDKILLNDVAFSEYGANAFVQAWGDQNWLYVMYPNEAVAAGEGCTLEIVSGLTIGDSVIGGAKFRLNSEGLWRRVFTGTVNATYSSIYSDDFNNGTHATGYNRIMFKYSGTAHGETAAIAGAERLKNFDNYVFIDGSPISSFAGGQTQIAPWGGQPWIQIIYPADAVSEGSVLTINEGFKIGAAVFEKIVFKLNSSAKWEKLSLVSDDTLVANSNYKLFTISDYKFAVNDAAGFIFYSPSETIDAMSDSFGFRFIVNIPEDKMSSLATLKFAGTDIFGASPIFQVTLNYSTNAYLTFNGAIDWSTNISPVWSAGVDHLVEIYAIRTSETTCVVILGLDNNIVWKSAVQDITGLTFHNFFTTSGTANTASMYSSATDTAALAVNRYIEKQINVANPSFESATAYAEKYLTTSQNNLFASDAAYSDARKTYYHLEADSVIDLINAIGEVDFTKEDAIAAARNAYEALSLGGKSVVDNYATLEAAENRLAELKGNKTAGENVDALIDAIGEVDLSKEIAIASARSSYNALNDEAKTFVTKLSVLEAAEVALQGLKDQASADEVDALINAIGEVTLAREDAINAARTAYNGLNDAAKALVTKLGTLENAETRLSDLKTAKTAAESVDTLINAIGTVDLSKESAINSARSSYNALNDDAKSFVTALSTLEAAETRLNELKTAKAAAEAVDASIEAIGEVTLDKEEAIVSARTAYNALNDDAKSFVTKLSVLEAAEVALQGLKDQTSASQVDTLIDAIGEVTLAKEEAIVSARTAYNVLNDAAKALVSKLGTLEAAETRLTQLKEAKAAAGDVDDLINAIGEVTLEKEEAITSARNSYNALNDDAKSFVKDLDALVAAENRLAEIKGNKASAEDVDNLINAIGEVTLEKETAITEAREAYNALNEEAKGFVTKLSVLEAAETRLNELKTAKAEAEAVDASIEAIGEVTLDKEEAITSARTAYNALNDDAKSFVTKLSVLEAAEARLNELKGAKTSAEGVDSLIDAIGQVTGTKADLDKINAARSAYDALNADAKAMVSKLSALEAAESVFASSLKRAKDAAIARVEETISGFDLNRYSTENKELIESKTNAVKASINGQTYIDNLDSIVDAYIAEINEIPTAPVKTGCGGNVMTSSILLSSIALLAIAGFALSKKIRKE